jgi:type II secretory pathway component PulJ
MRTEQEICDTGKRGVALLEALVAMTILCVGGLGVVGALNQALRSESDAGKREVVMAAADRVLSAIVLLSRTDLERRLGQRPVGEFLVDVERPERGLFRIAIAESRAPELETLVTVVFRPESVGP